MTHTCPPNHARRTPSSSPPSPALGVSAAPTIFRRAVRDFASSRPRGRIDHILREAVAESERPVLLFSGGRDSAVLLRLAVKASSPAHLPFPVMHVGTGHNFPEMLDFRDRTIAELGANPVVASVQEATDQRCVREKPGESRNRLRRTHARLSHLRLDRDGRVAIRPRPGHRASLRSTSRTSAGSASATAC